jgi:hypothetical protein
MAYGGCARQDLMDRGRIKAWHDSSSSLIGAKIVK